MEHRQRGARIGECKGMRQLLRERARLVAAPQGLVRIAQGPQRAGVKHQGSDPRVLAIGEDECVVLLGIVQREALGKMRAGLGHRPHEVQRQAQGPMGHHEGGRVLLALGQVQKLLGLVPRLPVLAADPIERTQAIQHRETLGGLPQLLADLPRPGERVLHLGRSIALGGDQGRAEGTCQVQLVLQASVRLGQGRQDREPSSQVLDGFEIGGALQRPLPSLLPAGATPGP